jgi:hypothetical protein
MGYLLLYVLVVFAVAAWFSPKIPVASKENGEVSKPTAGITFVGYWLLVLFIGIVGGIATILVLVFLVMGA